MIVIVFIIFCTVLIGFATFFISFWIVRNFDTVALFVCIVVIVISMSIISYFCKYTVYDEQEYNVEEMAQDYNAKQKIKYINPDGIYLEELTPHKEIVYEKIFGYERYTLVEYKYREDINDKYKLEYEKP